MQQLWEAADFVRKLRMRLRFGSLSRAELKILRFELHGDITECEWIARASDPWDRGLQKATAQEIAARQALEDCLRVRDLLFYSLPQVSTARLRVYRSCATATGDLIIAGTVSREEPPRNVKSVAMRARLYGLRFWFDGGALLAIDPEERFAS